MRDHDRRISATQMNIGFEAIKKRLRGQKYRLYTRVCANIGVYTSGNEMRMGKGKGSFDYWAARVGVNRMIFELKGDLHEEIVRDAFRLAGNKMPGEFSRSLLPYLRGPQVGAVRADDSQDSTSSYGKAIHRSWASRSWRMESQERIC